MRLTDEQAAAVNSDAKRQLVLALPGSGKTTTLVAKAIKWLEDGISPNSISLLTYSRRAAAEMRSRLLKLAGPSADGVHVETVHAAWYGIVCQHAKLIGYSDNRLTLVGNDERKRILQAIIKGTSVNITRAIAAVTSTRTPPTSDPADFAVAKAYRHELVRDNATDYAILYHQMEMLLGHEEVAAEVDARMANLLVDEFQDADRDQYEFFRLRSPERWMVVCDPNQTIYGWRGADPSLIESFAEEEKAERFHLTLNHRSTIQIVAAANEFQSQMRGSVRSAMTASVDGPPVQVAPELDVAAAGECAVLCRTNWLVDRWSQLLNQSGVPHHVVGRSERLAEAPVIRSALAYLAFRDQPNSGLLLDRICAIESIGTRHNAKLTAATIRQVARETGRTLFDAAADKMPAMSERMEAWSDLSFAGKVMAAFESVIPPTAETDFSKERDAIASLAERFEQDVKHSQLNGGNFLNWIARLDPSDDTEAKGVVVMTIHAAKGLEFDTVIVGGLGENELPCRGDAASDPAEEERLFYVAMTRAKRRLILAVPPGPVSPFVRRAA